MRQPSRRLSAVVLVAGLLVAGACGGDDGDDDATTTTSTVAAESSTAPDEAGATTTGGGDDTVTTSTDPAGDGGDDSTTSTAPDTSDQPDEGSGAPAEEAPDVSWSLDATEYRGRDGERIAYLCPPDGELDSVWGTDTYTDDSSVCTAAVHQGIINTVEGGRVVIEVAPGEEAYVGSEANGVTTNDYASWGGSYTFPPA